MLNKIIEIINGFGIDFDFNTISYDDMGLDFYVAFINDKNGKKWVIKIPKRKDVVKGIKKEEKILNLVRKNVSIEIPLWKVCTDDVIISSSIDGISIATPMQMQSQMNKFNIDPSNKIFLNSFSKFLIELHSIKYDDIKNSGLETPTVDELRNDISDDILIIKDNWEVSDKLLNRWKSWVDNDDLWPDFFAFTHGDLHGAHILVDKNQNLKGILDWSLASYNDISRDFMLYYFTFGEEALDLLLRQYSENGGKVWKNIKKQIIERMNNYVLILARFAIKTNIEEYYQNTQDVIDYFENKL